MVFFVCKQDLLFVSQTWCLNSDFSQFYSNLASYHWLALTMGCDGGTIPKRHEIVKNKQKDKCRDKNSDLSAKWQFCSISGLRLKKPIVSCQLGRLYNKDAVIECLLEHRASKASSSNTVISHIKSLKDVKELRLKEKPDFNTAHQATSGNEQFKAQFVCPISGLDVNGRYKFYYLWTCGCVFSERALKEVPNDQRCILCSKSYSPELDLIILNGDELEMRDLRERISTRRKLNKSHRNSEQEPSTSRAPAASTKEKDREPSDSLKSLKRHKAETVT